MKQKILIGYSSKLFAEGLTAILESIDHFHSIADLPLHKGISDVIANNNQFDILFLELNSPTRRDKMFIAKLKNNFPELKILLISYLPRNHLIADLLDTGIDAYLLKSCSKKDVIKAVKEVLEDNFFYCPEVTKSLASSRTGKEQDEHIVLTNREKQVLFLLVNGKTNEQAATELNLSINTIKTHRKKIQAKFGVSNLIGMIRFACRSNLLDFGTDDFCIHCPHFSEY